MDKYKDSVKILHTADLHIPSKIPSYLDKNKDLYDDIILAFKNIMELCKSEKVEILLIAGDFFDSSSTEAPILNFVLSELGNLDAYVFIAPGNHDYLGLDSVYTENNWPDNVYIYKKPFEIVEIKELNTRLIGGAFQSTYSSNVLFKNKPIASDGMINIGLCHGDLVGSPDQSTYNPITKDLIYNSEIDYLALGHIHLRSEIKKVNQTYLAYPGCPQGLSFKDQGQKGVYLGHVSKTDVDLDFYPTGPSLFVDCSLKIDGHENEGDLVGFINERLEDNYGKNYRNNYYRIDLKGIRDKNSYVSLKNIIPQLEKNFKYIHITDSRKTFIDYKNYLADKDIRGFYTRRLAKAISESQDQGEKDLYAKALNFGLRAFEGDLYIDEYY